MLLAIQRGGGHAHRAARLPCALANRACRGEARRRGLGFGQASGLNQVGNEPCRDVQAACGAL